MSYSQMTENNQNNPEGEIASAATPPNVKQEPGFYKKKITNTNSKP